MSQTEVTRRHRCSCRSPEITFNSPPGQLTYVVGQDTLFIQPHACFHLNVVTDNRLTDHHVPVNSNVIPDVGMFQLYIVTCWNSKEHHLDCCAFTFAAGRWMLDQRSPMVQLFPMTLLEMLQLAPMLVLQPIRTFSSIWLPWPKLTPDPR